jgi:hypothetical protein
MADFGGFNVTTPQEILARLQAQRDQFRQSQDPAVRRQANMDSALDALFGNPQVRAAERVTKAINQAGKLEPVEGEGQLETELRRLRSMRAAVEDIDPSVASQINQRMLVLGAEKLERDKLLADQRRADAKETREIAAAGRDSDLHPLNVADKAIELQEKAAETSNWINPRTGEIVTIPQLDDLQAKRLMQTGWVRTGLNVQVDDPEKVGGLTKAATTDLQKSLLDGQQALDGLGRIMQNYDPSFTTLPTQILNGGKSVLERMGLPVEQSAKARQYYEFRADAVNALNTYINKITGAAMGVQEEVRIRRAFPDAEKDGHTQFVSKLRSVVKQTMQVERRARQALDSGLKITNRNQWESVNLPDVTDAEVDAFMQRQFGLGASGKADPTAPTGASTTPPSSGGARIISRRPIN